ncbi:MAG: helix-turn-helix transcriptional regulator [Oscillospiraceae bacterium]|nr:helix-turn-helix transcriptional regulator [Oscillospiraceae bacterium]
MKYLGKRLRELRIKNNMSQEYVAKTIGVSSQAISKWENGKSDPEIGSLIPLADLFHVPVDELLDREKRRRDWADRMTDALADADRNVRLRFLKDAVLEFPGDRMFRYRLACEEYVQACEETDAGKRRRQLLQAEERFAALRRESPDFNAVTDVLVIDMYVRVLTALDRREEAAEQAKASPNRERLLLSVLEGDELAAQKRKVAAVSLLTLLTDLTREGSPEALRMVESIVTDAAGQEGQLLGFLVEAYCRQAQLCCERRQTMEALAWLQKGYGALETYEEQKNGKERITFLSPVAPHHTKKEYAMLFLALLREESFVCLRELPGFQTIRTGAERMAAGCDT